MSAVLLGGCGIVQGFQNASDAVFPAEKTYLDAPGFRIAAGGFRSLEFAAGTDLYLEARAADPKDASLFSMLYGDPKPCAIPNVHGHVLGDGTLKGPSLIAYFESEDLPGIMHFADGNCHVYDFTVRDSWPPYTRLPEGYLVVAGGDLVVVDPLAQTMRTLAPSIENVFFYASLDTTFVQSGGRLGAFGSDFTAGNWVGDGFVTGTSAGGSFFIEDRGGIHRLTSSGGSNPVVTDEVIAPNGCTLGAPLGLGASESWVSYYAPCDEHKVMVYGATSKHASELGLEAHPSFLALMPAPPKLDGDPAVDPFFVFRLENIDQAKGLGTLSMQTPDHKDYALGENAAFERLTFVATAQAVYGYVLVDVAGNKGRYIRFQADGSTQELGRGVLRGLGDILADYDGHVGTFALPSSDHLDEVAHGVFPGRFRFRDAKNRWTALLHEFDGSTASLSITESTLDFSTAASSPGPRPTLAPIAGRVVPDWRTTFISSLPGIAYLTDYDATADVGRLEYRNLQLGFTATVSAGVSDYVSTPEGLIYAVPGGASAGIWAVRAR